MDDGKTIGLWPRAAEPVLLAAAGLLLLGGLYLTSWYSFLLFHCLAELFSIIVAGGIFVIVWNSRRFLANGYFLFLGISYLFIGALDLVHALAYKGMGVFLDHGTDLATQLWISARYMEAGCLLAAVVFIRRRPNAHLTLLGLAGATGVLLLAIFVWHVFPTCFVEGPGGGGLTGFKKASEYVICGLFAATMALLWLNRERFDRRVLGLTIAALGVSIAAEISFTEYVSVYGSMNAVGHLLKVVSFYLVYRAIIVISLAEPHSLLFRELKQMEGSLRRARDELEQRVRQRTADLARTVESLEAEARDRLAAEEAAQFERQRLFNVFQMLPGYVSLTGADYRVRFANDGYQELFGRPEGPCHRLKRHEEAPCEPCPLRDILGSGKPADWEWVSPAGLTYHAWGYPFTDVDGTRLVLELGIDVTERKRLSQEVLRISEDERQRIGRDLHDSLGQLLSGVSCLTQVLRRRLADQLRPEAADAERIEQILAESLQLTRTLSRGLNTVGPEPDSLVRAMRLLAANTEKMFGISCLFRSDPAVQVADAMAAMHLYRIAQEATHNAVRHGRAKLVAITLSRRNGQLELAVRDDGTGLPTDAGQGQGMGLRIMRYRAESIGARLQIVPRPEGGTAVICRMPVRPEGTHSDERQTGQTA